MLLLQDSFHRVCLTAGSFAGVAVLLIILRSVIEWSSARQKLKKLGQNAPLVAYKLPFGTPPTESIPSSANLTDTQSRY